MTVDVRVFQCCRERREGLRFFDGDYSDSSQLMCYIREKEDELEAGGLSMTNSLNNRQARRKERASPKTNRSKLVNWKTSHSLSLAAQLHRAKIAKRNKVNDKPSTASRSRPANKPIRILLLNPLGRDSPTLLQILRALTLTP